MGTRILTAQEKQSRNDRHPSWFHPLCSRESITDSNYDTGTDEIGMYLGLEEWKAAVWYYPSMYPGLLLASNQPNLRTP